MVLIAALGVVGLRGCYSLLGAWFAGFVGLLWVFFSCCLSCVDLYGLFCCALVVAWVGWWM